MKKGIAVFLAALLVSVFGLSATAFAASQTYTFSNNVTTSGVKSSDKSITKGVVLSTYLNASTGNASVKMRAYQASNGNALGVQKTVPWHSAPTNSSNILTAANSSGVVTAYVILWSTTGKTMTASGTWYF